MRKSLRIASMVLAALLFFSYDSLKAQVKIGGNPADVDEHAILELESSVKGLLLPRVGDIGMNAMLASANEGFIVFYNGSAREGAGLYVKIGTIPANAVWVKLSSEDGSGPWKLTGNANADANSFIGPIGNFPLVLKSNGLTGLILGTDGKLKFGNNGGYVTAAAATDDVLMIATDGTITRKPLGVAVTKLEGLSGEISYTFDYSETTDAFSFTAIPGATAADPSTLQLNLPVMGGQSATQPYGLMKIEDWTKLKNLTTANGLSFLNAVSDPTMLNAGGRFAQVAGAGNEGKWTLQLNIASVGAAGIVNVGAQTFGGDKTFDGNLNVVQSSPTSGNLTVEGTVTLPGTATISPIVAATPYNVIVSDANVLKQVVVPGWKLTDKGIATITTQNGVAEGSTTGNLTFDIDSVSTHTPTIESLSPDKITFFLPNASTTANSRGLVTAAAQTFGGAKTFANSVTVGAGTSTTSNFNVNGSVGVKFRTVSSGMTLGPDDYIVLIEASAGATTLTLPDATTASGRVYVIKRVPIQPLTAPNKIIDESASVTVNAAGGQFINGTSAFTKITVVHTSITLMSDGTGWQLLSRGTGL